MAHDDLLRELLDTTDDLDQLSDRQLLERIARAQQRLEQIVTQASEYLDQALDALDQQLQGLQSRLSAEAAELQAAVEQLATSEGEHQAIVDAAQRVQQTADLVAGLALPSEVADPDSPAEATPVEQTDTTGETTPAPDETTGTGTGDTAGDVGGAEPTPPADVDQSY